MSLIFRHAHIVTPTYEIPDGYIVIDENGVINEVGWEPLRKGLNGEEIFLNGYLVGPGFIDTHIHGFKGIDVMNASVDDVIKLAKELTAYGVTSFIPTTVSAPHEEILKVCRVVKEVMSVNHVYGARVLGLHLEGPYINPKKAGAHNKDFIREPNVVEFDQYFLESGRFIREVTVAPELRGALDFIRYVSSKGVVVQVGHTEASYETTLKAIACGVSKATHLYNAMGSIHHRSPGAPIALLSSKDVFIELIADYVHVAPEMLKFTIDYAGPDRVVLITDAISAAGLGNGEYLLGGLEVIVEDSIARLRRSGVLAGSTLTMSKALKNVRALGYSLREVFTMLSTTPAKSIGAVFREKVGIIKPGFKADLVILNNELEVVATLVNGKLMYNRENMLSML